MHAISRGRLHGALCHANTLDGVIECIYIGRANTRGNCETLGKVTQSTANIENPGILQSLDSGGPKHPFRALKIQRNWRAGYLPVEGGSVLAMNDVQQPYPFLYWKWPWTLRADARYAVIREALVMERANVLRCSRSRQHCGWPANVTAGVPRTMLMNAEV
jgi:hypothetical protein